MPDQSRAADEHALLAEITGELQELPPRENLLVGEVDFPVVLRGYDRIAVDSYVRRLTRRLSDLEANQSPDAAVRRALERVGEEVSGILQRAHETADQITANSRSEAEDRLESARLEAAQITARARERLRQLDAETDRIWSERMRILDDVRNLSAELLKLSEESAERFPAAPETGETEAIGGGETAGFGVGETAVFGAGEPEIGETQAGQAGEWGEGGAGGETEAFPSGAASPFDAEEHLPSGMDPSPEAGEPDPDGDRHPDEGPDGGDDQSTVIMDRQDLHQ